MLGEGSSYGGIHCDEWSRSTARRYTRRTTRTTWFKYEKRACFQRKENEILTHTQLNDGTSLHEQKHSLNTLFTRTVVMMTSHETSTGAAKQPWSTSSLGGSWALSNHVNLISTVYKCECRFTHNGLSIHIPRAMEPAHGGPTVFHPGAQSIYLSATLLPN